jgi:hypothetical protein
MYRNLKYMTSGILLTIVILFSGCSEESVSLSNIEKVKNSVINFDKSITIGQAFDNWNNCKNKQWNEFTTDNQRQIVEFTCKINTLDCTIQWAINLDDTTKIIYGKLLKTKKDGQILERRITTNQLLKAIYANK